MAWQDRLQKAAYVAPSGTRIEFAYEDVSQSFDKKTGAFEFPNVEGTLVQEHGNTGRRIPFTIFISGNDYDIQANAFDEALRQSGVGTLEHPIYGSIRVVPFGPITRRDDLLSASNQAVFEVQFWETIESNYPQAVTGSRSGVLEKIGLANTANINGFAGRLNLSLAGAKTLFKSTYLSAVNGINTTLGPVAEKLEDANNEFSSIFQGIVTGIDQLVETPSLMASQVIQLAQTPAQVAQSIRSKISTYTSLANTALISVDKLSDFSLNDMLSTSYIGGSILSALSGEFDTRTSAIAVADDLATQFDAWTAWREAQLESLGEIDSGESYQATLDAFNSAQRFIVSTSFDLAQERAIVLTSPRSAVDLCAQFYGNLEDETLNFFINSNRLTGSEIYDEIPAGRKIVYYI